MFERVLNVLLEYVLWNRLLPIIYNTGWSRRRVAAVAASAPGVPRPP